jgi:hypothetical protein
LHPLPPKRLWYRSQDLSATAPGLPDDIHGYPNQKSKFGKILEGLANEDVYFIGIWHIL